MAKRELVFHLNDRKNDYYKKHEIGVYLRNVAGFKAWSDDLFDNSIQNIEVNPANEFQIRYLLGNGTPFVITNNLLKTKNILSPTTKAYLTGTDQTTTGNNTQYFDTGVYLDNTAGSLVAEGLLNIGPSNNRFFSVTPDNIIGYKPVNFRSTLTVDSNTVLNSNLDVGPSSGRYFTVNSGNVIANKYFTANAGSNIKGGLTVSGTAIFNNTLKALTDFYVGPDSGQYFYVTSGGVVANKYFTANAGSTLKGTTTITGTTNSKNINVDGNIAFTQTGSTGSKGVSGSMANNDWWEIKGVATSNDTSYLEICTGDNGNEAIVVRQKNTCITPTGINEFYLLDTSGNGVHGGSFTIKKTLSVNSTLYANGETRQKGHIFLLNRGNVNDQLLKIDSSGRIVPSGYTVNTLGGYKAQGSAPSTNFLWVDTAHGNILKFYSGGSWKTVSATWA